MLELRNDGACLCAECRNSVSEIPRRFAQARASYGSMLDKMLDRSSVIMGRLRSWSKGRSLDEIARSILSRA